MKTCTENIAEIEDIEEEAESHANLDANFQANKSNKSYVE
jgi:hypothetical protein